MCEMRSEYVGGLQLANAFFFPLFFCCSFPSPHTHHQNIVARLKWNLGNRLYRQFRGLNLYCVAGGIAGTTWDVTLCVLYNYYQPTTKNSSSSSFVTFDCCCCSFTNEATKQAVKEGWTQHNIQIHQSKLNKSWPSKTVKLKYSSQFITAGLHAVISSYSLSLLRAVVKWWPSFVLKGIRGEIFFSCVRVEEMK